MPRASSILCIPAVLVLAGSARAIELPVIVNGVQVVQAPKTPPVASPDADKAKPPVIINNPSAALQPTPAGQTSDGKQPVIVNMAAAGPAKPAPARIAVAYTVPAYADYVTPVAYNTYGIGSMVGFDGGMGYGLSAAYGGGFGNYGGYGYGGYVVPAYDTFGPWGYGSYPPLVEVLDTGVRANVGRLVSIPSVRAPVYGSVIGVYYR